MAFKTKNFNVKFNNVKFKGGSPFFSPPYGVMWDSSNPSPVLKQVDNNGDNITLSTSDFDNHPVWNRVRCSIIPSTGDITYGTNPRGDGLDYTNANYIMVEQNQAHIMSWTDGDWRGWCLSGAPFVGEPLGAGNVLESEVHPLFYQRGHVGNPAAKYYAGAYGASRNGTTELFSKKGATVSTDYFTSEAETTMANTIGAGWGITNIWYWALKQLMMYTEYKTLNVKSVLGEGFSNVNNTAPQITGADDNSMAVNGTFGGTDTQSAIYRGEDAVYGGFQELIVGLNGIVGQYNFLNADGSGSANGKVKPVLEVGEYTSAGTTLSSVSQFVRNIANTSECKYLFLPTNVTGASVSTYFCVRVSSITPANVPSSCNCGGQYNNPEYVGPGAIRLPSLSTKGGARLEFIAP